ncbi:MAG: hypothetical protein U5K53_09175 [Halanaerobiales bacterium]|nr:hypothetical protein [Halanaerobiales bacterium]
MKLKLIGSLFVALIFYLITILIKLFQFNPLPEVFRSGLKISITAFVFTLVLSFVLEFFEDDSKEEIVNNKGNKKQEGKQPKGKVSEKYKTNDKNSSKQSTRNNQSSENNIDNNSNVNKKREEEFNQIKPPVIEYEEK